MSKFSEDLSVEEPTKILFENLGWETKNCYEETYGANGTLGRETRSEVVLIKKLLEALHKLNPDSSEEVLNIAIEEITHDRSTMSLAGANKYIYKLLKDGVKVDFSTPDGDRNTQTIKIIDWQHPENNNYFLAQQFWITGELYTKRTDLLGFINGIPLIFIELKASHEHIEDAFNNNLNDYKDTIPNLFWYNGLIILSNGTDARIGSMTSGWEHFNNWKKIDEQGTQGIVSLETMIRGVCEKTRLIDLLENFVLFQETGNGLIKAIAKNHQYFGVNSAIEAVHLIKKKEGKLGVFWHTQGSGKTFSMMFLSQKVLREIKGGWTFVVVTDRNELDDQAYKNFADAEVVTEPKAQVRATSRDHLKKLLQEDHRFIFTTLQKFFEEKGREYPKLSDRSDVIVITDEAHRSQYDTFALNMRTALPKASFLGFTGTPLVKGDNVTREVFGEYVSVYDFKESIIDEATVPLYYENRIPEVQLKESEFKSGLENILEEAELNPLQEKKLNRDFATQYQIITRNDRLEKVAQDIVDHFIGRGFMGKAMVMSIDKATTCRMYDKVKKYWRMKIEELKNNLAKEKDPEEKGRLSSIISYMNETDMAVVVSPSQNEGKELKKYNIDIKPHRERIVKEDLDKKFKDEKDAFRIVFLCAMWMTGFDVPSCSTLYIDKPMKDHSLMQALARANRVFPGKTAGMIVDYVGIFQNIRLALAIYGEGPKGQTDEGDMPILNKEVLIEELRKQQNGCSEYFERIDVDIMAFKSVQGFELIKLLADVVDKIETSENTKKEFITTYNSYMKLFKAILPDKKANEFNFYASILNAIMKKIYSITPGISIENIRKEIELLLDRTIIPDDQTIREKVKEGYKVYDISQLNVDKLKEKFLAEQEQNTMAELLKNSLQEKVEELIRLNKNRIDLGEKLEKIIEEYNSGKYGLDSFFDELLRFTKTLNEEEKRAVEEGLNEQELAVMDILMKPRIELSNKEKGRVKEIAKEILWKLNTESCFTIDWRKTQRR
jgi:type I restriction enzyme R subunit